MNVQSALLAHLQDSAGGARPTSPQAEREVYAEQELSDLDPIVSAALLVTSAFRLRDETALIATLRLLTSAVTAWEQQRLEPANDA